MRLLLIPIVILLVGSHIKVAAQSVSKAAEDNSVEAQLEAFELHEDFEINLFADESMGIANPVAMHWGPHGKLWVLTTLTYAQLEPGENPNDTLVVLEDTDADGRADKSTVFADGLNMPMGFALGQKGVFLGEGPDLVLLKDTDRDGKADEREVLLTGFGTGDTHQNISNFTWGNDGKLYFCQGLHCYSRVETPWGIVRGDAAGFWRFDPETLKLESFCFPSMASQNPCGIVFGPNGSLFIKSNNRELFYATPGLIPTTRYKNLVPITSLGSTPGKSMGGEYVTSPHLPDWIQDHILIAGYYARRVTAFPVVPDGAGYAKVTPVEILYSTHPSFRPVEIKNGPDGAIYVADWFNPIIGHYQASLRHPDRDEAHGRIWRISAKGRKPQPSYSWSPRIQPGPSDVVDKVPFLGSISGESDLRARLNLILHLANSGKVESLPLALEALDHPRDRFIDYALEQTVHALAGLAMPALKEGTIEFKSSDHLAWFIETLGTVEALDIARTRFASSDLSDEARVSLARVLARRGNSEDLDALLKQHDNAGVFSVLVEETGGRRLRPNSPDLSSILSGKLTSEDEALRHGAATLAGRWRVPDMGRALWDLVMKESNSISLRGEAVKSFAALKGKEGVDNLVTFWAKAPGELYPALVSSLLPLDPEKTAALAASELAKVKSVDSAIALSAPFFTRKGRAADLLKALRKTPPGKTGASHLASAMSQMGQSDETLLGFLQDEMGIDSGLRAYSADFVKKLVSEVAASGNPEAGEAIYQRAELTCVACHQLADVGGIIGPSLDAVGAGLSTDLLVESLLWPQRQLKEGYFAVAVSTKAGDTYSGYREKEENGVFFLRDTVTRELKQIPRVEISRIENTGSLMPRGLTNSLSREELRDLVAYLASLKG